MDNQKSKRLERYRQKIRFAAGKIAGIIEEPDNQTETDASLYRVQTAIEAVMDTIAMLVKDKGQEVSDDYSNIHILQKCGTLTKREAEKMSELNGLRNAIVHKYNTFEESTVIESLGEIRQAVEKFLEKAEHESEKILG